MKQIVKKQQISSWVKMVDKTSSNVLVSDYCYDCLFTGHKKTKTLLIFPDQIESRGIIAINKPLSAVEILDVLKLYKRLNA